MNQSIKFQKYFFQFLNSENINGRENVSEDKDVHIYSRENKFFYSNCFNVDSLVFISPTLKKWEAYWFWLVPVCVFPSIQKKLNLGF